MSSITKGSSSKRSDPGGVKTRSKSTPRSLRHESRQSSSNLSPPRSSTGQKAKSTTRKKLEFSSPPDPSGKLLKTPSKAHDMQKDQQSIGIWLLAIVAKTIGGIANIVYSIITFLMSRSAVKFMVANGPAMKGKASLFLFGAVFCINCIRNGLNGIQAETKFAR